MKSVTNTPTKTYNGWKNYETWNVALWINNDEGFYSVAQECNDLNDFIEFVNTNGCTHTPDGVEFDSPLVSHNQLNHTIFSELN